jgi:hypothetical protein
MDGVRTSGGEAGLVIYTLYLVDKIYISHYIERGELE